MVLTACKECEGQLSEQATACPSCGHPNRAPATAEQQYRGSHPGYIGALFGGVVAWFFGREFGLVAWIATAFAVAVLLRTRTRSGRWMAWLGLGLAIVYSVANLYEMGHLTAQGDRVDSSYVGESVETSAASTSDQVDSSGLGLTAEEFVEIWNDAATRSSIAPLVIRDSDSVFMFDREGTYEHRLDYFDATLSGFYDPATGVVQSANIRAEVDVMTLRGALAADILWRHTCGVLEEATRQGSEGDCLKEIATGLGLTFEAVEDFEVLSFVGWDTDTWSSYARSDVLWQVSIWDWGVWISAGEEGVALP